MFTFLKNSPCGACFAPKGWSGQGDTNGKRNSPRALDSCKHGRGSRVLDGGGPLARLGPGPKTILRRQNDQPTTRNQTRQETKTTILGHECTILDAAATIDGTPAKPARPSTALQRTLRRQIGCHCRHCIHCLPLGADTCRRIQRIASRCGLIAHRRHIGLKCLAVHHILLLRELGYAGRHIHPNQHTGGQCVYETYWEARGLCCSAWVMAFCCSTFLRPCSLPPWAELNSEICKYVHPPLVDIEKYRFKNY